jgi:hypothetical protein
MYWKRRIVMKAKAIILSLFVVSILVSCENLEDGEETGEIELEGSSDSDLKTVDVPCDEDERATAVTAFDAAFDLNPSLDVTMEETEEGFQLTGTTEDLEALFASVNDYNQNNEETESVERGKEWRHTYVSFIFRSNLYRHAERHYTRTKFAAAVAMMYEMAKWGTIYGVGTTGSGPYNGKGPAVGWYISLNGSWLPCGQP